MIYNKIFSYLVCLSFVLLIVPTADSSETPVCISGTYPHLAMFNVDGECGVGCVVPWASRLWVVTYAPHFPHGSSDMLYEITPELKQIIRDESVGGTHANRMIHRETEQLVIGPYVIDKNRNVRVISPRVMPGRLTATTRHLTDPENKVYFSTMEEGLYEVDLKTLGIKSLIRDSNRIKPGYTDETNLTTFKSQLPGYHGKGTYTGQGRLVYSNNGDDDHKVRRSTNLPSGALAEWSGEGDWKMVRRAQFTEVTGPGDLYGNSNPETDPVWSVGWDHRSVILMVLYEGKWNGYRLPKASHTYDGGHGWHTEWPRIRDIGEKDFLMTMHGTLWRFPATMTPKNSAGIVPRSSFLRIIGDFCRWNDRIVFGCDDASTMEAGHKRTLKGALAGPGCSQSNLWFVEPERLDRFGPILGRGALWLDDEVGENEYSEPYLFAGYRYRELFLTHQSGKEVSVTLETDEKGDGDWKILEVVSVPAAPNGLFKKFPAETAGTWIRLKPDKTVSGLTAMFHYRGDDLRSTVPSKQFDGVAKHDELHAGGGLLLAGGLDDKTLHFLAGDGDNDSRLYKMDKKLTLKKEDSPDRIDWMKEHVSIPEHVFEIDDASVIVVENESRWRFPKSPYNDRKEKGTFGPERLCREICTERDLVQLDGTFYELPRDNSGGFPVIRPIATHPYRITDYAPYRGLLVISGISADAPDSNPHIIKSEDGRCALWCGVFDDLWQLGKPRGVGGPWKDSKVEPGIPSDPYLMTGYDKKKAEFSHDAMEKVAFRVELDVCGNGEWAHWKTIDVEPGQTLKSDVDVDAYWIRLVSDKAVTATAVFFYE